MRKQAKLNKLKKKEE